MNRRLTIKTVLLGLLLTSLVFIFNGTASAVTPTIDGPKSGPVNVASDLFSVGTDGTYNGHIQVDISGGGLNQRLRFDFTVGQSSQDFTITPTQTGVVTLIASPGGDPKVRRTIYYNVILVDPTPTPTDSASPSPTATSSVTPSPSGSPTPTTTSTPSPTPTSTGSPTSTATPTASPSVSPTGISSPTSTPTPSPSSSSTPSTTPSASSNSNQGSGGTNSGSNDNSVSSNAESGNSSAASSGNSGAGNLNSNNSLGSSGSQSATNSDTSNSSIVTFTKPLLGSWRLLSSPRDRNRVLYGITQFGPQLIVDFTKELSGKEAILDIRGYRNGLLIYKDFTKLKLNESGDAVETLRKPLLKRDRIKVTVEDKRVTITTVY